MGNYLPSLNDLFMFVMADRRLFDFMEASRSHVGMRSHGYVFDCDDIMIFLTSFIVTG